MGQKFKKDIQYYKFSIYGFLKNLRFFEPFLILFLLEKNISFLQIGTLYALREVFINILEIPSGIIADVFGRKKSLIVSFLFYIISFIIFYLSNTFYIFIIAIIFYAIGDAFRTGTHKAMIFEYLKIKDGRISVRIIMVIPGHGHNWGLQFHRSLLPQLFFTRETTNLFSYSQ